MDITQEKMMGLSELLKGVSFLKNANENEYRYLAMNTQLQKYKRYEVIYQSGDHSTSIYYIISGTIKENVYSPMAKEVIRSIAHSGMIFGQGALYGEQERDAAAFVLDKKADILRIDARAIQKVFKQNGAVAADFVQIVGNKLRAVQSRLESIIMEDARTRVINFLKEEAKSYGNKVGLNELLLKHSFTQQDIADFTGTSRQTVTTVLNDLKRSNIISLDRRRILIRDFAQLS